VSGVAFTLKDSSPQREVAGKKLYFCCESCADYFTRNRERVVAQRHLGL
jgi:YHS domain-containing protein